jgi:hypothetical protein
MSTDHNRIKVADLEKNEPNKTLITNENGELEFSDITGGTQDLQSVLINGNVAYGSRASGGASTLLMNPDTQNSYSNNFFIFRGTTDSNIYQDPLQIYIDNRNTIGGSRIRTSTTGIEISQELTDIGKTTVKISNPIANTTINFPAKPEGTYTLATTDEITGGSTPSLDEVLGTNDTATDKAINLVNSANLQSFFSAGSSSVRSYTDDTELGIDASGIVYYKPVTSITKSNILDLKKSTEGNATFSFPEKDTGNYVLATLDDISSGGDSQNLQSVLDNGKDASIDGGNSSIVFFGDGSIENERYIDMSVSNGNEGTSVGLSNNGVTIYGGDSAVRTGYFQVNAGSPMIVQQDYLSGGSSSFNLPFSPTNFVDFTLPTLNEDGEKILPVSVNGNFADVNGNIEISGGGSQDLQSVIENGSFATLSSGSQVTFEDPDTFNKTKISGDKIEITIDNNGDSAILTPTQLSFTKSDTYVQFNKEGIKYTNDDGGLVKLAFGDIIDDNNITLKIPSNLTTGTYTFATLEEISDNFVHKTGEITEVIDGYKLFRSTIEINGEDEEVSTLVSSNGIIYSEHGYQSLRLAPNHLEEGLETSSLVKIPRKSGTLVMSVNGEVADESGNVVIASGSQDFQQTLINGSTATDVSNFVVSGSNGSVSLTGNGAEISNNQYGQLEISPNGVLLQNRGNTNPLSINGNNAGVNINGSYGQSLKMTSTGPAEFRSTQGILIQNSSNQPLDVYSTVQATVQGITGLDLLSQQGAVNIVGPAGINLSAIGGSNELKMVNESSKIQLLSQAGGIDINSSGGQITIKNTSGAGVNIGDSSLPSPVTLGTASTMELDAANLMLRSKNLLYIGKNDNSNYIVFQNDGSIDLSASSNQNIRISCNVMNVGARRTDFMSPIVLPTTTVANLPASPTGGYQYATVSDATSPTYLQPVVGGGTVVCPVFYNGTSWVAH